jgi:hypothetical protein
MNHTPGPWTVDTTVALGAYGVWTDYVTHPGHDGAGYGSQICSVLPDSKDISREQRDANARLIAAAPDLLAACEAFFDQANPEQWYGPDGAIGAMQLALAAIAKAQGR